LSQKRKNFAVAWFFVLPVLALHFFIVVIPVITGIYYSFTDWQGVGKAKFIGLSNYRQLFVSGSDMVSALQNNLKWLAFFITVPFVLALFVAFMLSQIRRGHFFYRIVFFIPYVLPSVIVATLWRFLLDPDQGVVHLFNQLGIPGFSHALLGEPSTVLWTLAAIDNWHFWGFLATLFLVAMQSISVELYEAASLDGAGLWHKFKHVTIPGIRPTLIFMLTMVSLWSFLSFDYIWVLTQGGPGGASQVLATVLYKTAFSDFNAGLAAAEGLTMAGFAAICLVVFLILRKMGWEI
jgi:raffinose/stachyose/melibiose transport system permease protein